MIGSPTEVQYYGSEATWNILVQVREDSGKLEKIVVNLENITSWDLAIAGGESS